MVVASLRFGEAGAVFLRKLPASSFGARTIRTIISCWNPCTSRGTEKVCRTVAFAEPEPNYLKTRDRTKVFAIGASQAALDLGWLRIHIQQSWHRSKRQSSQALLFSLKQRILKSSLQADGPALARPRVQSNCLKSLTTV